MEKHRDTENDVIPTKTLKKALWIACIIWYIILAIAIIIYSTYNILKLSIALLLILGAVLASIVLSFFSVAVIAILLKWKI